MSKQSITIKTIKLAQPNEFKNEHLRVEVYYSLGGMNYFTGETEPRGYWVSIQPMTITQNCTSFTGFTGVKGLLAQAHRFSQKGLESASQDVRVQEWTQDFMDAHGLREAP